MATETKVGARTSWTAWVVFGALTAVFAVAVGVRLAGGPAALEVSDVVPWAGLIAFFFLLASMGGGLLAVSALVGFGALPSLAAYQRRICVGAVACLASAGLLVVIDLGRPERVLNMVLHLHIGSPFAWDFLFLALSVALGAVCAVRRPGKILSCAAGLSGAAVMVVEGVIFVMAAGRGLWNSPSIPLLFLLEGVAAGFALVAFAVPGARERHVRVLAVLAAAILAFDAMEWVHALAPLTGAAQDLALLTTGPLAPLYWLQIGAGLAVPLVLLVAVSREAVVRAASALILAGIVAAKLTMLLAGQSLDILGGFNAYAPSLLEMCLGVGGLGFAGLAFLVGSKLLPEPAGAEARAASLTVACGVLEAQGGEA